MSNIIINPYNFLVAGFRGCYCGGRSTGDVQSAVIDYITIDTIGNATTFGNLTVARSILGGVSSETRGVCAGGNSASGYDNTIDYITVATTSNAILESVRPESNFGESSPITTPLARLLTTSFIRAA